MKIHQLTIPCALASLNEMLSAKATTYPQGRRSRRSSAYSTMKARYTKLCAGYAKNQLQPIDTPCIFHFDWFCKDRRTDPDNIASAKKFILDGLVQAGILPNDGWSQIAGFSDSFSVDTSERVVVTIMERPDAT